MKKVSGTIKKTEVSNENSQHPPQDEIIDRKELCKRLEIHENTAIRMCKEGKIPFFRVGRSIRHEWSTVLAHLRA